MDKVNITNVDLNSYYENRPCISISVSRENNTRISYIFDIQCVNVCKEVCERCKTKYKEECIVVREVSGVSKIHIGCPYKMEHIIIKG